MKNLIQILAIIFIANQLSFGQLTATITNVTNVSCIGMCDGTAQCVVLGGVSPYYFYWDNGAIDDVQTNLCAGVYTVTVTDSNSDNAVASVTITEPAPIVLSATTQNSSCGNPDGFIDLTVTGGCGVYSYVWSNAASNQDLTNLPEGVYCVTVTDCNGCTNSICANINDISGPSSSICYQNDVLCFGGNDGSATVCVSGGTVPYSYTWSNGNTTSTGQQFQAGMYCVTVTDGNGCNSATCVTISQPTQLTVTATSTNEYCNFFDGSVNLTVAGGIVPYSYNWVGQDGYTSTTEDLSSMHAGMFCVTITDFNGCINTACATITESVSMIFSNNITNATCNEANGTATINITNGIPPFYISFLSDTSQEISSTLTNLSAGVYFIQISDSTGCSKIDTILINNIGAAQINLLTLENVQCNGQNNGMLELSASGGISPYTISWSHDSLLNSFTANNLFAGNYIVTVADSVGCVAVQSFGITQPGTLFLYITKTDANCGATGTATAHPFGGTQPYSYNWNVAAPYQTITNLTAGLYSVTVNDAKNCQTTGTVLVNQYCWNLIKGKVFIDEDDDCFIDSTESKLCNIALMLMPGYQYAYTNSLGEYSFWVNSGTYTISIASNVSPYYSLNCPSNPENISVTLPQMGDTLEGNNFAFVYDSTKIDLQTYLSSDIARPGFNYHYYINYRYFGHDTINATLTLTYDSILTYSYSSPAETYSSYPEIKWDLTLAPNAFGYVYAYFVVPTIPNGGYLGRVLHSVAKIEPYTNDLDTLNNISTYNRVITGSYDPNEKEVFPIGYGTSGAILPTDSVLTYTIHFQNTGTDTAFTVVVIDTLCSYVDPATVVSGASSHPYEFELSGQGILKWTFNQILLVDSTTNEPASNGFVTYTVKQKANNPHNALIENKAEIFFDFNPNIITNTATNKVDYYLSVKLNEQSKFSDRIEIYPNPFNENATISVISNNGNKYEKMEIYNITGSKIKTYTPIAQSKNFEIQKGDLKSGIYFIKLNDNNKHTLTGKLIVY